MDRRSLFSTRLFSVLFMWLPLFAFGLPQGSFATIAAELRQPSPNWHDTGVMIQEENYHICFDSLQPNVLLVSNDLDNIGTVAYNWATGTRTVISPHHYDYESCSPNGLLYESVTPRDQEDDRAWRFSSADPGGKIIEHKPTVVAQDGSLQVYSFRIVWQPKLLASSDGGLTWEERGKEFSGRLADIAVASADARALYALVGDGAPSTNGEQALRIYFSPDAGLTWERRGALKTRNTEDGRRYQVPGIRTLPGSNTPVETLVAHISTAYSGSNAGQTSQLFLSTDGARTFQDMGTLAESERKGRYLFHTHQGILRYITEANFLNPVMELSTDGARSWHPVFFPFPLHGDRYVPPPTIVPQAPSNLFMGGTDDDYRYVTTYHSVDGGQSWHELEVSPYGFWDRTSYFSPYLPMVVFAVKDKHLYKLDITDAGEGLKATVPPLKMPGSTYFTETGHNISGDFSTYWQANGGLARFGYPLTDPFPEVSRMDGRVYVVQYFERAIMELHPYNAPSNRVMLGLLGTFAYEEQYGHEQPGAGAPAQSASTDDPIVFPQTGRTLGGPFRTYWQRHGGLEQFGYPVSDEFHEQSEENGQDYTVQYFERAVMELHPAQEGKSAQVMLRRLGAMELEARHTSATRR